MVQRTDRIDGILRRQSSITRAWDCRSARIVGGVTIVPQVKELQQVTIEAQYNINEITGESGDKFSKLMHSDERLVLIS